MRVDEGSIRFLIESLLAVGAVTLMILMWLIDPVVDQRAFGGLISCELVMFAMMIQIFRKPSLTGENNDWLLLGCGTAAVFLLMAVQLAST